MNIKQLKKGTAYLENDSARSELYYTFIFGIDLKTDTCKTILFIISSSSWQTGYIETSTIVFSHSTFEKL